jgi:hypothetical protein
MAMVALGCLIGLVIGVASVLYVYNRAEGQPTPALDEVHGRYAAELDRLRGVYAEHGASPLADFADFLDRRSDA